MKRVVSTIIVIIALASIFVIWFAFIQTKRSHRIIGNDTDGAWRTRMNFGVMEIKLCRFFVLADDADTESMRKIGSLNDLWLLLNKSTT